MTIEFRHASTRRPAAPASSAIRRRSAAKRAAEHPDADPALRDRSRRRSGLRRGSVSGIRNRSDDRVLELEELAREVDGPSAERPSKYREALVHSSSGACAGRCRRVRFHADRRRDADRERQAAAGVFPERRQLARDGSRMAKGGVRGRDERGACREAREKRRRVDKPSWNETCSPQWT